MEIKTINAKNERKHTIPRYMNQQELDNKSQAEALCKSILVTDHTRKAEKEK